MGSAFQPGATCRMLRGIAVYSIDQDVGVDGHAKATLDWAPCGALHRQPSIHRATARDEECRHSRMQVPAPESSYFPEPGAAGIITASIIPFAV